MKNNKVLYSLDITSPYEIYKQFKTGRTIDKKVI